MASTGRDLEDYWGETKTTPAALDNFFDEDSTINWTGSCGALQQKRNKSSSVTSTSVTDSKCSAQQVTSSNSSSSSILDNITTDEQHYQQQHNDSKGSSLGRSLGSLGEKLNEWRPPGVKKWSSPSGGGGVERCSNCNRLEREVAQLSSRLKASFSRQHISLPPSSTVRAITLGEAYSLHCYTSLSDKRELVQAALRSADSSALVAVLVYCKQTLSKQLFIQELEKEPVAAQSFLCYLKQRRQLTEAVELLLALGRKEEAALLKYRQCLQTTDHVKRLSNLTQLLSQQLADPALSHYHRLVSDQLDLLKRQRMIDEQDTAAIGKNNNNVLQEFPRASTVYDMPLLTTLYYCSMYHWGAGGAGDVNNTVSSPTVLKMQYRLSDRQYLWSVVRGRARVKHYYLPDQLASLQQTNRTGVLGALGGALSAVSASIGGGGASSLKTVLPIDRIVDAFKLAGAPESVLAAYLLLVEPKELRLRLALHHSVRPAVVEAYIALKDRSGLQGYLSTHLPPGSADFIKADTALKSGRWK